MMLNKIDSELHDVSVCLLEGSLIINNYDSSQKTFDTIIIPVEEISSDFAYIEGGTFTMGSPQSYRYHESNQIQHNATVSSFYIGKYELTQKEWKEVIGNNPSNFKGDDLPVERVNWYDAIEYCNKRSEQEGLTPAYTIDKIRSDPNNNAPTRGTAEWEHGDTMRWTVTWNRNANGYRLPTEAEWEYACRAGTTTLLSTENEINSAGWSTTTSGWRTHPVGQKQPNTWGLYDMYGNVWELCWDWYTEYLRDEQTNPIGPNFGSGRVRRGGSWLTYGLGICAALRRGITPASQDYRVGFRLVRNAE
ncbi:MAG: hypothetical protein Pg6A_17700 [Termitinemataceae bacterium]|nr:MAG: hypothetical protein Pg6A_17700 [Termitinemataceae bacterium]